MKIEMEHKIAKKLDDIKSIKQNYGRLLDKIELILSVLQVTDNLEEVPNVPPTRRHKLTGSYDGHWALDLDKNHRLIIKPSEKQDNPKNITGVIIVDIVDYH